MSGLYSLATGLVVKQKGAFTARVTPNTKQGMLTIRRRGGADEQVSFDQAKGAWSTTLDDGEYVAWYTVADPAALKDVVQMTAPTGSAFVYLGPKSNGLPYAWGAVTVDVQRGDPKNPWPPPGAPETPLDPTVKAWFQVELGAIDAALPKSAIIKHPHAPPSHPTAG